MRRLLLASAIALTTVIGTALPSWAVPYLGEPTFLGSFGIATDGPQAGATFDNNNPFDGAFTNTYQFELTSLAFFQVASTTNNQPLIGNLRVELFAAAGLGNPGTVGGPIGTSFAPVLLGGGTSQQVTQTTFDLVAGLYHLVISGVAPAGARYSGTLDFALSPNTLNEVPLPGALLLMGTVLAGGAGFSSWRKSRRQTVA